MTKARTLADMISDGVIGTTELADDVITPVKLDETGNYQMAQLNVGSGASITPDADADNLVIESNGATGITIGSSSSSTGSIRFADSAQSRSGMIYYSHITNEMRFYTDQTVAATINSSGYIGVANPNPAAPIDVSANNAVYAGRFVQSNTANGDGVLVQIGSTAASEYALSVRSDGGNTPVLSAKADGNVGIGTFTPGETLDVSGNIRALGPNSRVMFGPDGFEAGIKYATDATLQIASRTGENIAFTNGHDGAEHLRLTSSGNLKLKSTDTPGITGGVSPYLEFRAGQTNGQNVSLAKMRGYSPTNWGGDFIIETKPANGQVNDTTTETMRIDHAGRVTKPYQPSFSFPSSTNFSVTTTGYRYMNSSNVFANVGAGTSLNVGNHFNTSNGRFTAPVDGVYEFNLNYGVIFSSGYFLVYLEKNLSGSYYSIYNPTNQDGDWMFGTLNWKTFLYSGDFVTPMWNNNYSGGNLGHVKFSGHLIG